MDEKMKKQQEICIQIHSIHYMWKRLVNIGQSHLGLDPETVTNGRILAYLEANRHKDIFQKDVERDMGLTKSTISTIMSSLEEKGYIERKSIAGDARLKKIVLTDTGREVHNALRDEIDAVDNQFVNGISSEKQDILLEMLYTIKENLKNMEAQYK